MQSMRVYGLSAAIAALLVAPTAFAQQADTAAGKRFSVVGSATILEPAADPLGARVDGDVAPTLSATWHVNDNVGVELWGAADKFNHRVRSSEVGKLGTVDAQPVALSAQYHFGSPDATFRPFLGLGYHQTNISNESIGSGGEHVSMTTPKGAIGTAGVDININPTWFARLDARYLDGDSDVKVAGQTVERDVGFDAWTVGFGVGARF